MLYIILAIINMEEQIRQYCDKMFKNDTFYKNQINNNNNTTTSTSNSNIIYYNASNTNNTNYSTININNISSTISNKYCSSN